MKKVVAYIHTNRIHWIVEELQNIGIDDISIYQRFKPLSQISRIEFLCANESEETVRTIIRTIGNEGNPTDHMLEIFDPAETQQKQIEGDYNERN